MDTSEQYIKMCEKLPIELQQTGLTGFEDSKKPVITYSHNEVRYHPKGNKPSIKLWRQDELQKILPEFIAKVGFVPSIASHFADFVCSNEVYPFPFDTFEKSWLAFVMKEKYGKVWDYEKEDWVKAKKKEGVSRS